MFAVNRYGPTARRNQYKGHCSNGSVCLPFTRSDGYGRFNRSSRNDLCFRYPIHNHSSWSYEVRGSAKRGLSRIRDVLSIERDDHRPKLDHKKHFSVLDLIRGYSLTKSSRVLKRDMKYLVDGPGAMGFYAILGAVYALQINGKLNSLEAVAGSSAGSIVAFGVLVAKLDCFKLFKIIHDIDVQTMMKLNLKSFLNDYGMVPAERWRTLF